MKRVERSFAEIRKGIIREEVIEHLLITLARGHCLLTGIPGLGKTLLVKTLSKSCLGFKRSNSPWISCLRTCLLRRWMRIRLLERKAFVSLRVRFFECGFGR